MSCVWQGVFVISLLTGHLQAVIVFDRVDFVTDPSLLRINVDLRNTSAVLALSLDIHLLKDVDGKLMIRFSIFRDTGVKLNQIFSLPKTNYCTLLRNSNNIPFIRDFFNQVSKFGNIPLSCPIRRNNYYLDNFKLSGTMALPAGYDKGRYEIHFRLIDENQKVPKLAIKFKAFLRNE